MKISSNVRWIYSIILYFIQKVSSEEMPDNFQEWPLNDGNLRKVDVTGDGEPDKAQYRNNHWEWLDSKTGDWNSKIGGSKGDYPILRDTDGDNVYEMSYRKPNERCEYTLKNDSWEKKERFGDYNDIPVVMEFSPEDTIHAFGLWNPITAVFVLMHPKTNDIIQQHWGKPGDIPISGDFTGDGLGDFVVWQPCNGTWYIKDRKTDDEEVIKFGEYGDVPASGDFTGDGTYDFALWRPSTSLWIIKDRVTGEETMLEPNGQKQNLTANETAESHDTNSKEGVREDTDIHDISDTSDIGEPEEEHEGDGAGKNQGSSDADEEGGRNETEEVQKSSETEEEQERSESGEEQKRDEPGKDRERAGAGKEQCSDVDEDGRCEKSGKTEDRRKKQLNKERTTAPRGFDSAGNGADFELEINLNLGEDRADPIMMQRNYIIDEKQIEGNEIESKLPSRTESRSKENQIESKADESATKNEALSSGIESGSKASEVDSKESKGNNTDSCPTDFVSIGDGCYHFSDEPDKIWKNALEKCEAKHSSLVSLETDEEWKKIKEYLTQNSLDTKNWWLGGNDQKEEGKWKWVATDEPIATDDWCVNEPNNYGGYEHCLKVKSAAESHNKEHIFCWNDYNCNGGGLIIPLHYICELNK